MWPPAAIDAASTTSFVSVVKSSTCSPSVEVTLLDTEDADNQTSCFDRAKADAAVYGRQRPFSLDSVRSASQ
jgi:hypothetical protein